MIIALDYDKTFNAAPELWKAFVDTADLMGHDVIVVTMRKPEEVIKVYNLKVYYTSREAKRDFMRDKYDINPDVWIDDQPEDILYDRF